MTTPKIIFTRAYTGCHADGAFGHQHCRETLADLIDHVSAETGKDYSDLAASLRGDMPDDAGDEDEALDILQEHTADGVVWTFDGGDLLLMSESEVE